jgi:hypothetical protein
MTACHIRFDKPERIFNPQGLLERIAAHAATSHGYELRARRQEASNGQ